MRLFRVLVPKTTNKGVSTAPERAAWERLLRDRFSGFTREPEVTGCWEDKGTIFWDTNIPYTVAVNGSSEDIEYWLGRAALTVFADQFAIMVSEIGTSKIVARIHSAIEAK